MPPLRLYGTAPQAHSAGISAGTKQSIFWKVKYTSPMRMAAHSLCGSATWHISVQAPGQRGKSTLIYARLPSCAAHCRHLLHSSIGQATQPDGDWDAEKGAPFREVP